MTTFYTCSISYVNTPMFKQVASVMLTWRFCSISRQSVQVWPPCSEIIILKDIPLFQRNSSHFQLLSKWFITTFKICTSKCKHLIFIVAPCMLIHRTAGQWHEPTLRKGLLPMWPSTHSMT
jgi:hypothetical protein